MRDYLNWRAHVLFSYFYPVSFLLNAPPLLQLWRIGVGVALRGYCFYREPGKVFAEPCNAPRTDGHCELVFFLFSFLSVLLFACLHACTPACMYVASTCSLSFFPAERHLKACIHRARIPGRKEYRLASYQRQTRLSINSPPALHAPSSLHPALNLLALTQFTCFTSTNTDAEARYLLCGVARKRWQRHLRLTTASVFVLSY
jgi:hypothetical protein